MAPPRSDRRGRREPEDTEPMLAGSDSDTAYEDDNGYDEGKTSAELRREDRSLLEEEEEREKLISRSTSGRGTKAGLGSLFRKDGDMATTTRGARRKSKKEPGRHRRGHLRSAEESELMYDTEEGGRLSSASSRDSSEADEQRLRALLGNKKKRVRPCAPALPSFMLK